ncbi:MAG TPA: hypothetical protein VJQ44_12540 [Gemmatimonadales bacterium]|nr:hypothetical protein [Gemmatimonadales bacterium]
MGAEPYVPESPVPLPVPEAQVAGAATERGHRMHLVVVRTRPGDVSSASEIVTRYWHPGRHVWLEQTFESLEHAMHLFVEEHGWELRQQQPLDRPRCEELIFAARPQDLDQPSARELLLEEVGLTPEDAEAMLDRVDERTERPES